MLAPRSFVQAAIIAVAATAILHHAATAQTSIDTPVGSPSHDQYGNASVQPVVPAMPSSSLLAIPGGFLRDGLRFGWGVSLGSWPAALVLQRTVPAGSSVPPQAVQRKSTR